MKKQVAYLQRLFYDIWNDFGSVYLLVKQSANTTIGRRGFTDEEKKQGLVLVFNDKTSTVLNWDAEGNIACVLAFGARKEDVFIHHDDLLGVFSPEAGVQLLRNDQGPGSVPVTEADDAAAKQVVSLNDFKKQKSGERP